MLHESCLLNQAPIYQCPNIVSLDAENEQGNKDNSSKSAKLNGTKTYAKEIQYHLVKQGEPNLYDKIVEYCANNPSIPEALEKSEAEYINSLPIKKRKKYKKRRWRGHSYGIRLILHVAYLLQAYHFAYGVEGKPINPSKATLAKEVGICVRTLDKALKILKTMGVVSWKSGKKTWETNVYYLADCYKTTPMRKPEDFKHPRKLWLKQQYHIKKQKLKEFTRTLYEHLCGDIADHLLRRQKFLRSSLEKKKNFGSDPPKKRGRPILGYLLKPFKLSFKDQVILSSFGEAALRAAIDDLQVYTSWGKQAYNVAAFLVSRCKDHREKTGVAFSSNTPENILKWLKRQLIGKPNIKIIQSEEQVDRADNKSTFARVLVHKNNPLESIVFFWKKINGYWIDKRIPLKHERLKEVVAEFVEDPKQHTVWG